MDLPLHGCSGKDLAHDEKWWNGADFLQLPSEQWPIDPQPTQHDAEVAYTEVIKQPPIVTHSLANHFNPSTDVPFQLEKVIDPQRYSKKKSELLKCLQSETWVSNNACIPSIP